MVLVCASLYSIEKPKSQLYSVKFKAFIYGFLRCIKKPNYTSLPRHRHLCENQKLNKFYTPALTFRVSTRLANNIPPLTFHPPDLRFQVVSSFQAGLPSSRPDELLLLLLLLLLFYFSQQLDNNYRLNYFYFIFFSSLQLLFCEGIFLMLLFN